LANFIRKPNGNGARRFYRNVLHAVPRGKAKDVALMLKAIHAREDKESA
jgi:transposase-like protein